MSATTITGVDVAIVKGESGRDRVYVTRDDGSEAAWTWPSYPSMPHDLVHLVVEAQLGLTDGFWGLVAEGVDFHHVQAAVEQAASGSSVPGLADRDLTGLVQAEACVGALGPRIAWDEADSPATRLAMACERMYVPAPELADEALRAAEARLDEVQRRWWEVAPGAALHLRWPSGEVVER